jgi:ribonucleoside-triphosphate reductase (formate)
VDHPLDKESVLITFAVKWEDVPFEVVNGTEVNLESAVAQLERYKMLMQNWCQQNVSATISYDVGEIDAIVDWLYGNWDVYVGVSFLFRTDPTKTAKDLGYLYLPQEVVTKEKYDNYVANLQTIELNKANDIDAPLDADCENGVCPVR